MQHFDGKREFFFYFALSTVDLTLERPEQFRKKNVNCQYLLFAAYFSTVSASLVLSQLTIDRKIANLTSMQNANFVLN